MDKYEMNLKMEQIKKLAAKKAYREAAEIANEINWLKVKDWSILATVINVQEAVGDYEEARDVAIIAYNRNLGGKKLVYKLTQLLIKLQQFDDADELYDEYDRMAYRDADRYVLFYELRKAEGASDSELMGILEEYKEQEADERYLYELATLYAKYTRVEDCIKICDDMILWFQDGEYVEKAIKLKQELGGELTNMQKKIQADAVNRKQDEEATKELLFEQQKEIMKLQRDELEELLDEEDLEGLDESEDYEPQGMIEAIMGDDDEEDDDEDIAEADEELESAYATEDEETSQDVVIDVMTDIDDEDDAVDEDDSDDLEEQQADDTFDADMAEKMNQIPENIQSMIEDAKKQIDNKYDQFNKEEEAERVEREKQEALIKIKAREDEIADQVSVPSYNIYDTQNIQEQLAKNFSEYIDNDDESEELESLKPSPKQQEEEEVVVVQSEAVDEEDEQIEGQMNLAEWLENVREEKYGKQNTKQYSRSEVARILEDKDEKSAAYDKMIEEQKAARVAAKEAENSAEAEVKRKAREQMMLHAAKTDLAIRTGKATLKLEEAFASSRVEVTAKLEEQTKAVDEVQVVEEVQPVEVVESVEPVEVVEAIEVVEAVDVDSVVAPESVAQEESVATAEQNVIKLNTATFEPVTEEVISAYTESEKADDEIADVDTEEAPKSENEATVAPKKKKSRLNNPVLKGQVTIRDGEKRLTGDLAKLFRKYREMPGIEAQLIDFFESINDEMNMTNSKVGNLIISGNSSSDKIDLARTIVRAINFLYPEKSKKIAKTTGDSINSRGIEKAMPKLYGTALIVEGAGAIQPKRIKEIMSCLESDTGRMIVIFEDSDAEMNVLINFNPELVDVFNHRIVLKQYTVNELVEIARKYANKKMYDIDDDALLELYLKIDNLHNTTENIRLDDIKEIINFAVESAERRASKKLFGGLKKRAGKNGMNLIMPQDFRD